MASVNENTAHILVNRRKLYELESVVLDNKFKAYEERAMIEENQAMICKNYAAAFIGNRQMANANTDGIFRNRAAIVSSIKANGEAQEQLKFRGSKLNEAKIDFLEHRSCLNSKVVAVSERLSQINSKLIDVNSFIMEGNAGVVEFNSENIAINSEFIDGSLHPEDATPEQNAVRIQSNTDRIEEITKRANVNSSDLVGLMAKVTTNRASILSNMDIIYERRAEIQVNHHKMLANVHKIAEHIGSGPVEVTDEKVLANKETLYQLETSVMSNKFKAYEERSMIEENRARIMKNYAAAFHGNRLMTNANTESTFRNREAILTSLKVSGQVQINFRDSKLNEARIGYLDHRSKLNARFIKCSKMMSEINAELIEVNRTIMANNGEIVHFNSDHIAINTAFLDVACMSVEATSEANNARIKSNTARIGPIQERAKKNSDANSTLMDAVKANRIEINANSHKIYARRQEIEENEEKVVKNAGRIVDLMAAPPAKKQKK